jgi:aldehyde dehydrogenase (NAD(P)+)
VPGPYDDDQIAFQARSIVAGVLNNASFNCNAVKLLVLPKGCESGAKLLDQVQALLEQAPLRKAYYPGAEQRWKELVESHPNVERYGEAVPGTLPWAIIPDLDSGQGDEKCFHMEPWCSVVSETTVGSADPVEFLEAAVKFCNDRVWGTLSATIIIHPTTAKDPRVAAALDKAIRELRYGTVAINHWPALGFAFGTTPWGGHPSSTLEDIQSGKGWVHNAMLINDADIEKCVIRGPLVAKPKPAWFADHKTGNKLGPRLVKMEADPSAWKLPGLIWNALRG